MRQASACRSAREPRAATALKTCGMSRIHESYTGRQVSEASHAVRPTAATALGAVACWVLHRGSAGTPAAPPRAQPMATSCHRTSHHSARPGRQAQPPTSKGARVNDRATRPRRGRPCWGRRAGAAQDGLDLRRLCSSGRPADGTQNRMDQPPTSPPTSLPCAECEV